MKKALGLTLISLFLVTLVILWKIFDFLNTSPGISSQKNIFEVKKGQGFYRIARGLKKENLITDVRLFYLLAKLRGKENSIRVGEYELSSNMFPSEVLSVISSGKSKAYDITFQEGLNIFEMAEHLEKEGLGSSKKFLELCRNRQLIKKLTGLKLESLEGYLFPETYKITKYTGERELILLMNKRFKEVFSSIRHKIDESGLTPREIVILASIIEKETGQAEDRPIISSVFHNRLRKKMRLQTDPTTIYGLWLQTGQRPFDLKKKHLRQKNDYNTYTFRGLPKGPISNPGKDSLLSAMNPRQTKYFYFVSRNDGTTVFSENYKKHQKAVRRYQLNRKAREGKSWRDLKKKKKGS